MRLDRFLTRRGLHSCKEVSAILLDGRIRINGEIEINGLVSIDRFTRIELDSEILQDNKAIYLMLHKPAGFLSATCDPHHPTVIELIAHPSRDELHLAGRLDRASTGLLLLTNNGRWSKGVTEPTKEIPKVYRVTTRNPIAKETLARFQEGIYFAFEDIITRPAHLEIVGTHEAIVTLHEGRYHQVKRMFHAVGNQVQSLHREQIGPLLLDETLPVGSFRHLTPAEISHFIT